MQALQIILVTGQTNKMAPHWRNTSKTQKSLSKYEVHNLSTGWENKLVHKWAHLMVWNGLDIAHVDIKNTNKAHRSEYSTVEL